jgi:hypothetical protein
MLYYIKKILSVNDYAVSCLFNTGEVRVVNLKETIEKYKKINDGLISQLSDNGTLTWTNGVDFDPDVLYKMSEPEIVTIQ